MGHVLSLSLIHISTLYTVDTPSKGKTKAVCEDLAVFLRNWSNRAPFRFGVDGTLYYICLLYTSRCV